MYAVKTLPYAYSTGSNGIKINDRGIVWEKPAWCSDRNESQKKRLNEEYGDLKPGSTEQ
jgi:hypothetical protein